MFFFFVSNVRSTFRQRALQNLQRTFAAKPGHPATKGGLPTQSIPKIKSRNPRIGATRPASQVNKLGVKTMVLASASALACGVVSAVVLFNTSLQMEAGPIDEPDDDDGLFKVEPRTGVEFPALVRHERPSPGGPSSTPSSWWLLGSSVRCMLGMCSYWRARVYAFALYTSDEAALACVGAESAGEALQRIGIAPPRAATSIGEGTFAPSAHWAGARQGFVFKRGDLGLGYYPDGANASVSTLPVMLRIVLARDVGGDHLAKGFDRALMGRVRSTLSRSGTEEEEAAASAAAVAQAVQAVHEFTRMLRGTPNWSSGQVLDFVRRSDGALTVRVDGEVCGVFAPPLVAWALLDTFLGQKGHFPKETKAEMGQRLMRGGSAGQRQRRRRRKSVR